MGKKDLIKKLLLASNEIAKKGRSSANYVIASSNFVNELNRLKKQENRELKIDMILDKKTKYDISYLKMAKIRSELSNCERKKVGALIVKNDMIISDGFNGTPSGFDNCCENDNWETHWFTIHAEANAILKCAKYGNSCKDSVLYLTHSPCKDCSKLILQSGIKRVVYIEEYKDLEGVDFLINSGICVEKLKIY